MAVIGAFPNTIRNGDAEDATVVMALFAFIQSQVNSNACPATTGSSILKGNGSGGTLAATAGTDYFVPSQGEAVLPSAATTDIGSASGFIQITGTTPITSFGASYNGPRFIRFSGALILTHNASTLILPGAANITTAAGDTCIAIPLGTGWYVAQYTRADGTQVAPQRFTSGVSVASTSGTFIDYTSVPSWAKRITINLAGVSTNGASALLVQIGAGSVSAAGYVGNATAVQNAAATSISAVTTGFGIVSGAAANILSGSLVLTLIDAATGTWVASGNFAQSAGAIFLMTAGHKVLSGTLDRIRLTTIAGADTFDAGSVNITWE